jgi:hypothetical protein
MTTTTVAVQQAAAVSQAASWGLQPDLRRSVYWIRASVRLCAVRLDLKSRFIQELFVRGFKNGKQQQRRHLLHQRNGAAPRCASVQQPNHRTFVGKLH